MDAGTSDLKPAQQFDLPDGLIVLPGSSRGWEKVFSSEEQYKCFTTQEYQVLANIILDYRWFWGYAVDLELKLALKDKETENLSAQLRSATEVLSVVDKGRQQMTELFEREHLLRLNVEGASKTELWVWRVGVVVAAALAAGFAGAYGAESAR